MAISQGSPILASDVSNMCHMATGTGSGNSFTITCPFTPQVVLLTRGANVGGHWLFMRGQTTLTTIGSNGPTYSATWCGNSVTVSGFGAYNTGLSWAAWG